MATTSMPLTAWPDLHLEYLPYRDSLHYQTVYGLETTATVVVATATATATAAAAATASSSLSTFVI